MTIKNKSIRKQLFTKRLLMLLIPQLITLVLFLLFTLNNMKTLIADSIYQNSHNILTQTQENMELMMDEINTIQLIYDYDPTISLQLKAALNNKLLSLTELYLLDVANRFLSASVNAKPYIHSVYIYYNDVDDFFISSNASSLAVKIDTSRDFEWLSSYKEKQLEGVTDMWVEHRKIYLFDSDPGRDVISIYSPLKDEDGLIVFNIDPSYIQDTLNQLAVSDSQTLYILDKHNNIISQSGKVPFRKELLSEMDIDKNLSVVKMESGRFVAHRIVSNQYYWQYISLTPFMDVYRLPINTILLAILAATLAIFFSVYITLHQTRENYSLINNMVTLIEAAEKEQPLPPLTPRSQNVYSYISENILKTFIEQKYLMTQLSEKQYKFKTMELLALQSQINPHFLYNTLENIYWQVIQAMDGPSDTSTMLENLSDILRYSLSSPEKQVTLREELHHTTCYLHLMQIRYEDKFTYDVDVQQGLLDMKVIKLFLQPFIENAIYHGIKNKETQSHLRLRAYSRRGSIILHILDTGSGMSKHQLHQLRDKLKLEKQDFDHIGVCNTYNRLRLVHSQDLSIRILSKEGQGTCITICIPKERT